MMDRRLIILNLRLGVALVCVSISMVIVAFLWAAFYITQ
jgi:hypothetical protein